MAAAKIGSYATVVIPLTFAAVYTVDLIACSLYGRIQKYFEGRILKQINDVTKHLFHPLDPISRLKMIAQNIENPHYLYKLIHRFGLADYSSLKNLFVHIPDSFFPTTAESLCLFLFGEIDQKNTDEILRYCKQFFELDILIQKQFFYAFMLICPSNDFMNIDEQIKLFKSLINRPQQWLLYDLNFLCSINFDMYDKEMICSFRRLFSELIYCDTAKNIIEIFNNIYAGEADEREEWLFVINEISQTEVKFYNLNLNYFLNRKRPQDLQNGYSFISRLPKGERKEVMILANRWYQENKPFLDTESYSDRFRLYRKRVLKWLIPTSREDRNCAELELRVLEIGCGYVTAQNQKYRYNIGFLARKKIIAPSGFIKNMSLLLQRINHLLHRLSIKEPEKIDEVIRRYHFLVNKESDWQQIVGSMGLFQNFFLYIRDHLNLVERILSFPQSKQTGIASILKSARQLSGDLISPKDYWRLMIVASLFVSKVKLHNGLFSLPPELIAKILLENNTLKFKWK